MNKIAVVVALKTFSRYKSDSIIEQYAMCIVAENETRCKIRLRHHRNISSDKREFRYKIDGRVGVFRNMTLYHELFEPLRNAITPLLGWLVGTPRWRRRRPDRESAALF